MSDENLAEIRNEKAKKIQHPKGKLTAYERLNLLLDEGSFSEIDQHVASEENPVGEAVITGTGTIHGRPVFVFSEDFSVMGGSLGEVVAKKILKIIDHALEARAPIIGIKDSGGARIQEGISSLFGYAQIFKKSVEASIGFYDKPYIRFEGKETQQETFFVEDPNYNMLEIKSIQGTYYE